MLRDGYTIALDSNVLRPSATKGGRRTVEAAIAEVRRRGGTVVVPDAVLLEQAKNDRWQETCRRAFAVAAAEPELFAVSVQRSQALAFELENGSPIERIIHAGSSLLAGLGSGDPKIIAEVGQRIHRARSACASRVDASANHKKIRDMIDLWRKILTRDELRRLRRGQVEIADMIADEHLRDILAGVCKPFSRDIAYHLLGCRSYLACHMRTLNATALRWIAKDGFEGIRFQEHAHEALDREVIEIGLLCDSLYSLEKHVEQVHEIVGASFVGGDTRRSDHCDR